MANTERTEAELLALIPNGKTGGITAQDLRDIVVSCHVNDIQEWVGNGGVGEQGPQGVQGSQGNQGFQGVQGTQGDSIVSPSGSFTEFTGGYSLLPTDGPSVAVPTSRSWISSYLHVKNISVTVGQKLTEGQQIAELGDLGDPGDPHLHWQVGFDGDQPYGIAIQTDDVLPLTSTGTRVPGIATDPNVDADFIEYVKDRIVIPMDGTPTEYFGSIYHDGDQYWARDLSGNEGDPIYNSGIGDGVQHFVEYIEAGSAEVVSILTIRHLVTSIAGTEGPQGPQGDPGATGATGFQGPQGYQGYQGETGLDGPQGFQGDVGAQGPQGTQGDAGATGAQGPQGTQGDAGATGAQGPQGFQGDVGATGAQGPQGFQGDVGATGAQGPQGFQGDVGTQGTQGFQGATGADSIVAGPQGFQGDVGATGAQGPQGFQGDVGTQGPQGTQGFQGDTGAASSVPGPQGDIGATGAQGPQGDIGAQGPQGFQGDVGTQGPQGFQGDVGPQGPQGATGDPSDSRLKTNLLPLEDGLAFINKLKVYSYDWNENAPIELIGKRESGLIAQEIEDVYNAAVIRGENNDDYLKLNYAKFVPFLIKAIQELSKRI